MKLLSLIDIDLLPDRNLIHSGLLLKVNRQVFIMLNFSFRSKKFDGIRVFRPKDIGKWRYWDKEEKKSIKVDNRHEYLSQLSLSAMNSFYSCLKQVGKDQLISFSIEKNVKEYYVGRILSLNRTTISLRLVNVKGKFTKTVKLKISELDDFGYLTRYEAKLLSLAQK